MTSAFEVETLAAVRVSILMNASHILLQTVFKFAARLSHHKSVATIKFRLTLIGNLVMILALFSCALKKTIPVFSP